MGMYNELNNIKRSIEDQTNKTESKSQKKYKSDNNLLIKLEYFIRLYKESKKQDIYNVTIQDQIIQKTITSCYGELQSQLDASDPAKFVENYQTQDERPDEEYCYIFCMRHYLQSCRNVEKYLKNENEKKENEIKNKQQITLEKWELQREKEKIKIQQEAEKLKKLQQQNAQREQVQQVQQKTSINWVQVLGIIASIIFLPIGLIILCVFAAAKNQK